MSRAVSTRLVGFLAVLLTVAGCSTVPSSSPIIAIPQAPAQRAEVVGIEPVPPSPGASPEEVVRSFIEAAASTRRGHPVARDHLAPEAAGTWSDETGLTIISSDYATVTTQAGRVVLTADLIGTVDARGVFGLGAGSTLSREFTLEQVDGEWRISDPPDGLIMLEQDFERLYRERAVYFLDPTGKRLVPDPRYLIRGEAQPTTLVTRLIEGPSPVLAPGVGNALTGVKLRSAVTVEGQSATVDLTAMGTDPAPGLPALCAQLVWTLREIDAPRITSVRVLVDGEPVDVEGVPSEQTIEDWASVDPDAVPVDGVGHYVSGGALRTVTAGEPTQGPAGTGVYGLTSAAVSADPGTGELSFLVGVGPGPQGVSLLVGPYAGELAGVLDARTLSVPTVAATRSEAWVIRDGSSVVRAPAGGPPQAVNVPALPGLGRAEVLRLSPDGVRAALVVDGPGGPKLYVSTVVRSEDGSVALRDLREIAPALTQVADVAWADSGNLLVLAVDAGDDRIVPFGVGVDGWGLVQVPTAGLPSQPSAIAAAPTRQPLVNAGGTIWQLAGGTWVTLVRGREPLPGTAPFYPL
jgi:hypothetical protein